MKSSRSRLENASLLAVENQEHVSRAYEKQEAKGSGIGWRFIKNTLYIAAMASLFLLSTNAHAERSFSSVQVDTTALGGGGTSFLARVIKTHMEPRLRASFANNLGGVDKNAPRLVVRITTATIQPIPEFGGPSAGTSTDFMEGEALVIGKNGAILQRYPMLSALDNITGGWYLPDYTQRRIQALSEHYAWWLRRQLPDR